MKHNAAVSSALISLTWSLPVRDGAMHRFADTDATSGGNPHRNAVGGVVSRSFSSP